ncbi:MEDS domain-containing protein [Sutcliffiella horikoshii]|uniref:MEDS domain-containing protein n=1 Tax=Sutcliffiella horikoshii TaxID=79883 RepID=UPI001CBD8286|nr:MEDS domain-containing protein [Sutcliffiella horikoshii]
MVEIKSILEVRPITTFTIRNLENLKEGHIYYRFKERDIYLNHLFSFIDMGIKSGDTVLIIESMKNLPKINEEIQQRFSEEQRESIRIVNNFDYYFSGGDFNTKTILGHFAKDVTLLRKDNRSVRTWAHVEWASDEPDAEQLKEYEASSDDFVIQQRMISVCAYSCDSLSPVLHSALEQVHKYVMTDDSFSISTSYKKP